MPKIFKEDETCELCAFCMPPPKRELILFPDGHKRVFSGVCKNPESPLSDKPLTANFDPAMNASFNALRNFRNAECFSRK